MASPPTYSETKLAHSHVNIEIPMAYGIEPILARQVWKFCAKPSLYLRNPLLVDQARCAGLALIIHNGALWRL